MASKFVLTAQLQLQAPTNTRTVVNQVRKQLSGVQMNIQPNVNTQSLAKANKQVQTISASAKTASGSLKGMAASSNSLGAALGAAARRFASITIATGFFLGITRAIGSAVGKAVEFEREMIKISQVTGKSVKQLQGLVAEVTHLSTTLGASSEELLNASRTLAQAGFSAEKVTGALKILAQTDLAATFNNIKDTTEGAIALLSQFRKEVVAAGGEVKFLEKSLDAINAVSKNFAVESADLISVIRRTGGVFEAAGGKLNELIAVFTSVRATTRETADTIATGFRTIFTRIQRTETIDSLKELGIVLQDTEGKFIGPMQAIERLSTGLRALDPRDFRFNEIVEQLGGFRQIGKVIPLLKQYQTSAAALAVANNSAGSTARDAATAQQGLGVQFEKLKEKFAATMRTLTESDTFKTMAASAIKLAESILSIVEALEPLLPMLTALMAFKIGQLALPALGRFTGVGGRSQGGVVHGFAGGGLVPGRGNRDTVPAMLAPGEFVMRKSAVKKIGPQNMAAMNQGKGTQDVGHSRGGVVQYYVGGTPRGGVPANVPGGGGPAQGPFGMRKGPTTVDPQMLAALENTKVTYGLSTGKGAVAPGGVSLLFPEMGKNTMNTTSARSWGKLPLSKLSTPGMNLLLPKVQAKFPGTTMADLVQARARGSSYAATLAPSKFPVAGIQNPTLKASLDDNMHKVSRKALERAIPEVITELNSDQQTKQAINSMKLSLSPADAQKAGAATGLDEQAVSTMKGFLFEGAIHALTGATPAGGGASFDIPAASVAAAKAGLTSMFGPQIANMKMIEVKSSKKKLSAIPDKIKTFATAQGQINEANTSLLETSVMMAKGGEIGGDTVPAMLTPGEFVLSKKSASKVGYGKLHRMNQSNGVKGFAAGGIVGSTRSNYGAGAGGGGGGSIGQIPGVGAASKGFTHLAGEIGKLVAQLMAAGTTISTAATDAATGIASIDNKVIAALSEGTAAFVKGLISAGTKISTVDEMVTGALMEAVTIFIEAVNNAAPGLAVVDDMLHKVGAAAFLPLATAIADAAKGIATVDDIMKGVVAAMATPLKAAMKVLETEMKAVGKAFVAKAALLDPLKKGATDLVVQLEKTGETYILKTKDLDVIKEPALQLATALGTTAKFYAESADDLEQIKQGSGQLHRSLTQAAKRFAEQSDDLDVIKNPAGQMGKMLARATAPLAHFTAFMGVLNHAVMQLAERMNQQGTVTTQTTTSQGALSAEFLELKGHVERLEAENTKLILAFARAQDGAMHAEKTLKSTKPVVAGAGGGGMGMMGNQMMMGAMMGGMMATQMLDLSEAAEKTIMAVTMLGTILIMMAMEIGPAIGAFAFNTIATIKNAISTEINSNATNADTVATVAHAGASAAATGIMVGLAIAATIIVSRWIYLSEQSKALAKEFTKSMDDFAKGVGGGMDLEAAKKKARAALQKEAEASASLWTGIWTALAVTAIAVGVAFAGVITGGAAWVAFAVIAAAAIAAAGAAGSAAGQSFANAGDAAKYAVDVLAESTYHAAKGLNELSMANAAMKNEQLEGVELMQRQGQAMKDLNQSATLAMAGLFNLQSAEASQDQDFIETNVDSKVLQTMRDNNLEMLQETGKQLGAEIDKARRVMGGAIDKMRDEGASIEDVFASAKIGAHLAEYAKSIMNHTKVQLMTSGLMKEEAKRRLDLNGMLDEELTRGQRMQVLDKEQELIEERANAEAEAGLKAQKRVTRERLEAEDKAKKSAAEKLAADKAVAIQAQLVATAMSEFEVALLMVTRSAALVDVTLGSLTGSIKQYKSDAAKFIATLKEGEVSEEGATAARQVGRRFGIEAQVNDLLGKIGDSKRIEDILTQKGLGELGGGLDEAAATTQWESFLADNNIDLSFLGPEIQQQIKNMLKDGLQPEEIADIMELVNQANEEQIETLENLAKAQDKYINALFKFGSEMEKITVSYAKAVSKMVDVQLKSAERLAKAEGRDPTVAGVHAAERQRRAAPLQARGLRAGGVEVTRVQLRQNQEEREALRGRIDTGIQAGADPEVIINLQNEEKKLAGETKALTENLRKLSNQSKLAAAVMGEIEKERGKRETIQGLIKEFTFADNAGREDMDRNFMALQRVLQTGNLGSIPDEMRGAVGGLLDTLKDVEVAPGMTGGDVSKRLQIQMANQLKIRATGQPLTREEMQKIWDKTPKEQKLIDDLRAIGEQEQAAAALLAAQEAEQMQQLITSIADLIAVLRGQLLGAGEAAGGVMAAGAARGGWVRFDEGGGVSAAQAGAATGAFAPQGTDTVPAMLTPGEFVVNRRAAQRNAGALQSINSGKVQYLQGGGPVTAVGRHPMTSGRNASSQLDIGTSTDDIAALMKKSLEQSTKGIFKVPYADILKDMEERGTKKFKPPDSWRGFEIEDGEGWRVDGGFMTQRQVVTDAIANFGRIAKMNKTYPTGWNEAVTAMKRIGPGGPFTDGAGVQQAKGLQAAYAMFYNKRQDWPTKGVRYSGALIQDFWDLGTFMGNRTTSENKGGTQNEKENLAAVAAGEGQRRTFSKNEEWTGAGIRSFYRKHSSSGTEAWDEWATGWKTGPQGSTIGTSGFTSIGNIKDVKAQWKQYRSYLMALEKSSTHSAVPSGIGDTGGAGIFPWGESKKTMPGSSGEGGPPFSIYPSEIGAKAWKEGKGSKYVEEWMSKSTAHRTPVTSESLPELFDPTDSNRRWSKISFAGFNETFDDALYSATAGYARYLETNFWGNVAMQGSVAKGGSTGFSDLYAYPETYNLGGKDPDKAKIKTIEDALFHMTGGGFIANGGAGFSPHGWMGHNSFPAVMGEVFGKWRGALDNWTNPVDGGAEIATDALGYVPWAMARWQAGVPLSVPFRMVNEFVEDATARQAKAHEHAVVALQTYNKLTGGQFVGNEKGALAIIATALDDQWKILNKGELPGHGGPMVPGQPPPAAAGGAPKPAFGLGAALMKQAAAQRVKKEEDAAELDAAEQKDIADRLQVGFKDAFFIFKEQKADALLQALGPFPGAGGKFPMFGPKVPKYSKLFGTKGFAIRPGQGGAFEDPNGMVRLITQIPRTSDSFNAMFPYLHRLGFNLHSLGMQGAVTGIDATGPVFNPQYIQSLGLNKQRMESIFSLLGPFTSQDPKLWGKDQAGYDGISKEEAWYTGLFMGGQAGPAAGMASAQAGVDMVQANARAAVRRILDFNNNEKDEVKKQAVIDHISDYYKARGFGDFRTGAGPAWLRAAAGDPGAMAAPVDPNAMASGGPVNWSPRGTDTVPTMLTPGEFVMKKSSVQKYGVGFMSAINSGNAGSGSGYMAEGGSVSQFGPREDMRIDKILSSVKKGSRESKANHSSTWTGQSGLKKNQESAIGSLLGVEEILTGEGGLGSLMDGIQLMIDSFFEFDHPRMMRGIFTEVDGIREASMNNFSALGQQVQAGGTVNMPLLDAIAQALNLGNILQGIYTGAGLGEFQFAHGGHVPGTGSGDTVSAMLTPGEFVMRKSAVDKYGINFMDSVNQSTQKFSRGGQVLGANSPLFGSMNQGSMPDRFRGGYSDNFDTLPYDTRLDRDGNPVDPNTYGKKWLPALRGFYVSTGVAGDGRMHNWSYEGRMVRLKGAGGREVPGVFWKRWIDFQAGWEREKAAEQVMFDDHRLRWGATDQALTLLGADASLNPYFGPVSVVGATHMNYGHKVASAAFLRLLRNARAHPRDHAFGAGFKNDLIRTGFTKGTGQEHTFFGTMALGKNVEADEARRFGDRALGQELDRERRSKDTSIGWGISKWGLGGTKNQAGDDSIESREGATVPFARGGPVGTDTVPAMLTPGEYVMKKSAVDKYGTSFMNAINSGSGPKIRPTKGVQYRQDSGMINPAGGGGFGDIVSGISSALEAFSKTFTLMSKLSTMLNDTISSMASMEIKHTVHVDGSLNIPGFSQVNIDTIVQTIGNQISENTQDMINAALQREKDKRDKDTG